MDVSTLDKQGAKAFAYDLIRQRDILTAQYQDQSGKLTNDLNIVNARIAEIEAGERAAEQTGQPSTEEATPGEAEQADESDDARPNREQRRRK